MKLYIITIDEVFDFEGFQHKPLIFLTKKGDQGRIRPARPGSLQGISRLHR